MKRWWSSVPVLVVSLMLVASVPASAAPDPHLQAGQSLVDQARELERQRGDANDPRQRARLDKQIGKAYRNAVAEFRRAVAADPESALAHRQLGQAYVGAGKLADALRAFDRSLELQPDHVPTLEARGRAQLSLGDLEPAKASYDQLLEHDGERAAEFLRELKRWVIRHRRDPAGVDPADVRELERWIHLKVAATLDELG